MSINGCLHVIRDGKLVLALPGPSITINPDGTIWYEGSPLLGVSDPAEKARIADLSRAKSYDRIPAEYFTRLGDNPNGLWAGDDEMWAAHPVKLAEDQAAAEKAAKKAKQVRIYLSSRGWGDYSSCEWYGDITRPDDEILAECRKRLQTDYDVDQPNQTDEEILQKIINAREKWGGRKEREKALAKAEAEDIQNKVDTGYCFNCESWCHGDCGNYSNDPRVKYARDLKEAAREADFGIND